MTYKRRPKSAVPAWLLYSAPVVMLVALAIGYKFYTATAVPDYSAQAKAQVVAMYARVPDQALVLRLIDQYHDDCFRKAYTPAEGGRGAAFDSDAYLRAIKHRVDGKLPYDQLHPRR